MRRRALAGLACVALLGACQQGVDAVPGSNAWPGPTPTPTPDPTLPVPSPEPEPEPSPRFVATPRDEEAIAPLTCGDEPLAVGFGLVQAALGTRVMDVGVLNCGDEAIRLGRPTLTGVDAALVAQTVSTDAPDGGTLQPGERTTLELDWRSNGRCERGIQQLTITIADERYTVEDCLQLGGEHAPDEDPTVRARWR